MNILFLCTANSCRSILSEALFNHLTPPGLRAFSAGSHPRGRVNPLSLHALDRAGIPTAGLASKGVEAVGGQDIDLVITVCDQAAGESCPLFPGAAVRAHWGLTDPSEQSGPPEAVNRAFDTTLAVIRTRIAAFLALPPDQRRSPEALARIGRLEAAGGSAS